MVHTFSINNHFFAVDVNSGSVHQLDEMAYDIITLIAEYKKTEDFIGILVTPEDFDNKYSKEQITECLEEIQGLAEDEVLFSTHEYGELLDNPTFGNPTLGNPTFGNPTLGTPVVKALCLHIAHDCNMKCRYCFAQEGEYHQGERTMMPFSVGRAAIDYIISNSGARRNLEIDFFGGEPLMNFDVVKQIVEYARAQEEKHNKKFRFTITTNGLLLNSDIQDYINKNMHNVVLSLDGRRDVNDNMRKNIGGQGTYDSIVPKFKNIARTRDNYYVRGTFTRNNLDFSRDVIHMAELGFKNVSVEPVVSPDSEDYAIREEDLEKIYDEYEKLAVTLSQPEYSDINFFHFNIDLEGGPCVYKRVTGCGAGTEYLAVTPKGELYPCHQFTGDESFLLGDVFTGLKALELREQFRSSNVYTKEACRKCWAKFYCSGGCGANAYNTNRDINIPYEIGCKLQRKRLECAIMLKSLQ